MNLAAIGSGLMVALIPGLAWLVWVERPRRDLVSWLADALALSISLTALVGLLLFLLGLAPGALGTAFLYGACLATLAAALLYRGLPRFRKKLWLPPLLGLLAATAATGALIWFRLYQARGLILPNWVDSVQHSLIVRIILEHGGLPATLAPYLDARFSYHYGFYLLDAAFAAWTQLPPEQAVLVFGQVLNGLISLALYRFARAAGLARPAAALAGLLSGFVLHMPAYYLTWGRYTLSTGLIVLLGAMAAALDYQARPDRRRGLRLAVLTAGVCLTHYLATVFLLLFFFVLGADGLLFALRKRSLRAGPWRLAGWALGGGLAALPWLVRAYQDNTAQAGFTGLDTRVQAADWTYLISLLGPRTNHLLMIAAGVGLLFALRHKNLRVFTAWSALMLFFSQPFAVRFGPFRPDLYAIALFIPAAIYLAALLADGAVALGRKTSSRAGWGALALAAGLLLALGVRETRDVINPSTVFVTAGDVRALDWVRANTPADARFYNNAAFWQGAIYRGLDGGYWLMPYTGRISLIPPVPYIWQAPTLVAQVNRWAEQSTTLKGCTPDFWAIVTQARLTHIYVRAGTGSLQPAALDECPRLSLLYREEGVSIYEIKQVR